MKIVGYAKNLHCYLVSNIADTIGWTIKTTISLSFPDLLNRCDEVYNSISMSVQQAYRVEEDTRQQSSNDWGELLPESCLECSYLIPLFH